MRLTEVKFDRILLKLFIGNAEVTLLVRQQDRDKGNWFSFLFREVTKKGLFSWQTKQALIFISFLLFQDILYYVYDL
jgi:hypothetical protein